MIESESKAKRKLKLFTKNESLISNWEVKGAF